MPYFVYRIERGALPLVKQLLMLQQFEAFPEAKRYAREQRAGLGDAAGVTIKVMFADSALQAEEQLQEQRAAPVLREWEK